MPTGIVKWFSERRHYGFIISEGGQEVFFHESEVSREDFPLRDGDRVIFTLRETIHGGQGKEIFKLPSSPALPGPAEEELP